MVNKTNLCPDVLILLILRSYFNTAEHFTLPNRVSTTAIETSAKMRRRVICQVYTQNRVYGTETQSFRAI